MDSVLTHQVRETILILSIALHLWEMKSSTLSLLCGYQFSNAAEAQLFEPLLNLLTKGTYVSL